MRWISLVPSPMVQSLTSRLELLDGIVLDEAVATEELHGLVADADRCLAGEELRHSGLARDFSAGVFEYSRALGQQACGIKAGGHVGELPLNALKFGDSFAELAAFFDVLYGCV